MKTIVFLVIWAFIFCRPKAKKMLPSGAKIRQRGSKFIPSNCVCNLNVLIGYLQKSHLQNQLVVLASKYAKARHDLATAEKRLEVRKKYRPHWSSQWTPSFSWIQNLTALHFVNWNWPISPCVRLQDMNNEKEKTEAYIIKKCKSMVFCYRYSYLIGYPNKHIRSHWLLYESLIMSM